jgi:hypothetical protein
LSSKNISIDSGRNIPLAQSGQCIAKYSGNNQKQRRYNKVQTIETVAVSQYRTSGKGITYRDLLSSGVAINKTQARVTLKHCIARNVLFAPGNYKPQRYYPTCLKAEILKKNILMGVTGVRYRKPGLLQSKPITTSHLDPVIVQTLEGYVLPLLPKAPLYIHKMQFKVKIPPECYHEIALPIGSQNKGKEHEEIISRTHIRYCFYANGTVMVFTESGNTPFKLEDELDLSRLIAFFGQVRDRLVVFLADKHERIVPDIMQWQLTQCDINKDIVVGNWLQVTGLKMQVNHFDRLFRIYIKSMQRNTICRVEESCNHINKPAIDVISDIFNPCDKNARRLIDQEKKLVEIVDRLKKIEAAYEDKRT